MAEKWYRIDNAGKLFPSVTDAHYTSTYRISIMLTEPIQAQALQQAVDTVLTRFPTMAVRLNSGVYLDYFSENNEPIMVQQEQDCPCSPIDPEKNNGHLLRILYYRKKYPSRHFTP